MLGTRLLNALVASAAFLSLGGLSNAEIIAHGPVLRVTPSSADTYVARGTLPLPIGWQWSPQCPFGLRRNGAVHPAQWWPVAFHPDGSAAVVELAATVPGETGLGSNPAPIEFEVVINSEPYGLDAPSVYSKLVETVTVPGALELRVYDSLGNLYTGYLSQPLASPRSDIEVLGRAKIVYVTDGLMLQTGGNVDALPYLGGFKAWFTIYDDGRVAELDLRWHNAVLNPDGVMIPNIIFESMEIVMPQGWKVTPRWPMPTSYGHWTDTVDGVTKNHFRLIKAGDTPHLLRQRGNLTWRFVLHRNQPEDLAQVDPSRSYLARRGHELAVGPHKIPRHQPGWPPNH